MSVRAPSIDVSALEIEAPSFESRMIRYRYGPWDPAYFTHIGRLLARGLVRPVPQPQTVGLGTTEQGRSVAESLAADPDWAAIATRADLLRRHFNLTANNLGKFIRKTFPEIDETAYGAEL